MSTFKITPEEDSSRAVQTWDLAQTDKRLFRCSFYRYGVNNWVHFRLFKTEESLVDGVRTTSALLQREQVHLNWKETKKLLFECEHILREASEFATRTDLPQMDFTWTYKATVEKDKKVFLKYWEISETPRRKITASCNKYNPKIPDSLRIQLKLFTRTNVDSEFKRTYQMNLTLKEFELLCRQSKDLFKSLQNSM